MKSSQSALQKRGKRLHNQGILEFRTYLGFLRLLLFSFCPLPNNMKLYIYGAKIDLQLGIPQTQFILVLLLIIVIYLCNCEPTSATPVYRTRDERQTKELTHRIQAAAENLTC